MTEEPTPAPEPVVPTPEPTATPEPTTTPDQTPPASPEPYVWGTGRRKRAVARVRLRLGEGKFLINKREVDEFFCIERDRMAVRRPLEVTDTSKSYDVFVNVGGGGITGGVHLIEDILGGGIVYRLLLNGLQQPGQALRRYLTPELGNID